MTYSAQPVPGSDSSRSADVEPVAGWPLLASAALLLVSLGFLLSPTVARLHIWWTTGYTYTHGYLVVLMCIWLGAQVFKQRDEIVLAPTWFGMIPMVVISGAFSLAVVLSIDAIQHLLLPALILSVAMAFGGPGLLRVTVAPVLLLYAGLPIWEVLNPPLQWLTIVVISMPLALHDFPVVVDGMYVTVPAGQFHVAGGCSGLHYLLVAGILGYFLAVSDGTSTSAKLRIVALAIVLALITNWVRVYTLILVGQYTDMQHYLIAEDHYFYGWVLFAIAMVVFFWIVRRWTRTADSGLASVHQAVGRPVAGAMLVAAAILASAAALTHAATRGPGVVSEPVPTFEGAVVVYRKPIGDWRPQQATSSLQSEGIAIIESLRLEWFVASYPSQGPTLDIASGSHTAFGAAWTLAGSVVDRDGFRLAEIERADGARRLVAWRTQVAGQTVSGAFAAKLAQLIGLAKGRTDAAFVAVSIGCEGLCAGRYDQFTGAAERWFGDLKLSGRDKMPTGGILK